MRMDAEKAVTTNELRNKDLELVIPLGDDGRTAKGELYLDDGESINPKSVTRIEFSYDHRRGVLKAVGKAGFDARVRIRKVTVLGGKRRRRDEEEEEEVVVVVKVDLPLGGWEVEV